MASLVGARVSVTITLRVRVSVRVRVRVRLVVGSWVRLVSVRVRVRVRVTFVGAAHVSGGRGIEQQARALGAALAARPVQRGEPRLHHLVRDRREHRALRACGRAGRPCVHVGFGGDEDLEDAPLAERSHATERCEPIRKRAARVLSVGDRQPHACGNASLTRERSAGLLVAGGCAHTIAVTRSKRNL